MVKVKKMILISFILAIGVLSFSSIVNDFTEPSAFSRAIGGAIYPLYEGAISITYNPAGVANDENEVFFSHTEHFLGVIRNDFLSTAFKVGKVSLAGSIQYTHPVDGLPYDQYKFTLGGAYKFEEYSLGMEANTWRGTDIKGGFSLDAGTIFKYENMNFSLVAKNIFSSITWNSTPLKAEKYSPEFVLSGAYFAPRFTASAYWNFNSSELGIGAIVPISNIFEGLGGWKVSFGNAFSSELSIGARASYFNFTLDVSYVFKDPFKYGDSISPFYISLTYNFPKGT
jgi:hypothetical protein